MSTFSITQHIDYSNHMKDYIRKTEAKAIIDNLKTQLTNNPIQSHPDYAALIKLLDNQKRKELSNLEQEMRKKTRAGIPIAPIAPIPPSPVTADITSHPDYPALVKMYEDKIRQLQNQIQSQSQSQLQLQNQYSSCPPCAPCPEVKNPSMLGMPSAANYCKLKDMTMII